MPKLDFWKKTYSEYNVLDRAKKRAKRDPALEHVIESLYYYPNISDQGIVESLEVFDIHPSEAEVRMRYRPQALRLIEQERAKNEVPVTSISEDGKLIPRQDAGKKNEEVLTTTVTEVTPSSIDDLEAEAVQIVMKAQTGITLNAKMKKVIIFVFKTFAPLAVLCLTIPESIWVFTHIYTHLDDWLTWMTGLFATLVDFGYLYLTVLLELNKEAIFKRRRAGLEVESHELKAVRIQAVLWWIVAAADTLAQAVFLYAATHNSTFFDPRLVMVLVCVRILSLFITMFVVSFAGTELMTDVDVAANEQVERAEKVKRVMVALGDARQKQQEARIKLEQMIADQEFRREGEKFLKEMYTDARDEARRQREAARKSRGGGSDKEQKRFD
jgi:hypothetical protein